jgi:HSP20 family protein
MSLIPWKSKDETTSPMTTMERSMVRLRDEVDSLFDRFLGGRWGIGEDDRGFMSWPTSLRADLAESENEVTVTMELPGVDPKDLEINVVGDALSIRGEKRQEQESKERNYYHVERQFGSFQRSIPLPASVDPEQVDADFRNGVLTVRLAKRPDARPKRIPVKTT